MNAEATRGSEIKAAGASAAQTLRAPAAAACRGPAAPRRVRGGSLLAAWIAFCLLGILAGATPRPLAAKARGDSPAAQEAPAQVVRWAPRDATLAAHIELSADHFATILLRVPAPAAEGSADGPRWTVPTALLRHFAPGTKLSWRVVEGQRSADTATEVLATGSFDVAALPTIARAGRAVGAAPNFGRAAKLSTAQPGDAVVPGEVLLSIPSGVRAADVDAALAAVADMAFLVEQVELAAGRRIARLQLAPGEDAVAAIPALESVFRNALLCGDTPANCTDADTFFVQPNFVYRANLAPTDPFLNGPPRYQYAPQAVRANDAWSAGITGNGVIVAVVDTGLNSGASLHQEFSLAGKVMLGPDFANIDNDPSDDNGHGTHVAGIIAAEADGVGTVGIAPEAKLLIIKAMDASGTASSLNVAQAIDYATHAGARVVNLSLGTDVFSSLPGSLTWDRLREQVLSIARQRGVVVVAAAGNDHASLPARPAMFNDALYVGAVGPSRELTVFSNYGPWLSLVAPGLEIYSTSNSSTSSYEFQSGTSQACPVVSGAVALILSAHPALSPAEVKELLLASADDLGTPGFDEIYGHGELNIGRALSLTTAAGPAVPSLLRVELSGSAVVATFSADMLADGSANAVNRSGNFNITSGLSTFFGLGRTLTWSAANRQLTITNPPVTITSSVSEGMLFFKNVQAADGQFLLCNATTTNLEGSQRFNIPGKSSPGSFVSQGYGAALATSDGRVRFRFAQPVTAASAINPAHYLLESSPTSTSGTSPTGGTPVSLSGTSVSYDSASQTATISGLGAPMTTLGTTIALTPLAGILCADTGTPLDTTSIRPSFGQVFEAATTPTRLSAVENNFTSAGAKLNSREVVRLQFTKPLRSNEALFTPSNYSITVNGSSLARPADMDILYSAGDREILLTGFDFTSNSGQALSVTVSNLTDIFGAAITAPNNAASSSINITSTNFSPRMSVVTAHPTSLTVNFEYWKKMDATTVTTASNWSLFSDATASPSTSISLSGASFSYDGKTNSLTIHGVTMTAGHLFRLVAGAGILQRIGNRNPIASADRTVQDIVGGQQDLSPIAPTAAFVRGVGVGIADHLITAANAGAVEVRVTLPATAAAGQHVAVTLIDSGSPARLASGSATLATGGAQTIDVTGIAATHLRDGAVRVQAMLITADSAAGSDVFEGVSATRSGAPTPTPTPSPSPSASQTPTPSLSPTASSSPTLTPSPSLSPSLTPSPTASLTPTETPSLSPTLTPTVSPTATPSSSASPTPSESPSPTPSSSPTASLTPSPSPTDSPTPTPSPTPSISPTPTPAARVAAALVSGNPCAPDSLVTFAISVAENVRTNPGFDVVAYYSVVVNFNPSALAFVSATIGDPIFGANPQVSTDGLSPGQVHLTQQSPASTFENGTLAFVTFRTLNQFPLPDHGLTLTRDTLSSELLVGLNTFVEIAARIDDSATASYPCASATTTPTASASPTPSPSISPSASPSPTPSASASPTPSPSQSSSATPTDSPTASPSASPTPSPSATETASPSPSPTASPLPTFAPVDSDGDGYLDDYELSVGSDPTRPDVTPSLGDLNHDGVVSAIDAILLYRALRNGATLSAADCALADVNGDGACGTDDALILYRWSIRLPGYESLPWRSAAAASN